MRKIICLTLALFAAACSHKTQSNENSDPNQWLEEVHNPKALDWVKEHDKKVSDLLEKDSRFESTKKILTKLYTADDRIPVPTMVRNYYRNFWTDKKNPRGVWRQVQAKDYMKKNIPWEILLDIDALNKTEKKSWVFKGANCLPHDYTDCLVILSEAGSDRSVVREFNTKTKRFIKNGFILPAAKSSIAWIDSNTVFLSTDFGEGSLTESGYPRQVRVWKRGEPFMNAKVVFEGDKADVLVHGAKSFFEEKLMYITRVKSFYNNDEYIYRENGKLDRIPFPSTADVGGTYRGLIFASLRDDWVLPDKTFKSGSVVAMPIELIGKENALAKVELVYEPTSTSSFQGLATNKDYLFINVLDNVREKSYRVEHKDGKWIYKLFPTLGTGTAHLADANMYDNKVLLSYDDFGTPFTLYSGDADVPDFAMKKMKSSPSRFDSSKLVVDQFFATSKDGTQVPYFVLMNKDTKLDGKNPVYMYAYGGFEYPLTPSYMASVGKLWLEKGGVYVIANIRGGGEYGPKWHSNAILEKKQNSYDDYFAVTDDLFNRKITSPEYMGIAGGSNGGLLMGVAFTQHPEKYHAIFCDAALLDMLRYHLLPPGASWMAEYGNPDDPKMAEVIRKYSPYQNIKAGIHYPKIFFYSSTADDRVQPGHTRKVVSKLEADGDNVLFFENTEGGHGGAADINQSIKKGAYQYVYFYEQLMSK